MLYLRIWPSLPCILFTKSHPTPYTGPLKQIQSDTKFMSLVHFLFRLQFLGHPRYCLIEVPFRERNLYILGFVDGSVNFSCGAVHLISHSYNNPVPYKYQLVGTCSKLEHLGSPANSLDTIPKKESYAMMQTAQLKLSITKISIDCGFKIRKTMLGIDALSNILALYSQPARFQTISNICGLNWYLSILFRRNNWPI